MSDRYIVSVIHGRHINPDRIHGMGRQTKHEQGEASVLDTAYCHQVVASHDARQIGLHRAIRRAQEHCDRLNALETERAVA